MSPANNTTGRRTLHRPSTANIHNSDENQDPSRIVREGRVSKAKTKTNKIKNNTSSERSVMWNAPFHDKKGSKSKYTTNIRYNLVANVINLNQKGNGSCREPSKIYGLPLD